MLLTSASPVLADREDELKQRRAQVGQRINQAEHELDESSRALLRAHAALLRVRGKLDAARSHLAQTRGQLAAARELDELMQKRLAAAEARLAAAERQLAAGVAAVDEAEDRIAAYVVGSAGFGDPELVGLGTVLSGADPSTLIDQMGIADSIAGAQVATLDELEAARTLLVIQERQVEEMRNEVAEKRAAAAENLVRMRELEAAAQAETRHVHDLVKRARVIEARAERAKARDLRRLNQIERERERIGDMLARIAARQARQQRQVAIPQAEGGGFLSFPVNSYITSSYGMRLHPILHVWKLHDGTDFGAACGTPVRAAAPGKVIAAYYNAGYGNRVIIGHGTANGVPLATSYNHLSGYAPSAVGEHVERGEVIGYVGTTGYSTGCHLHFMVYTNGATSDPMRWLT